MPGMLEGQRDWNAMACLPEEVPGDLRAQDTLARLGEGGGLLREGLKNTSSCVEENL